MNDFRHLPVLKLCNYYSMMFKMSFIYIIHWKIYIIYSVTNKNVEKSNWMIAVLVSGRYVYI